MYFFISLRNISVLITLLDMHTNRITFLFTFIISLGLLMSSCRTTTENPEANGGVGYYPLTLGKYIVYDVDSTYWSEDLGELVPTRWQFRYQIVDTFRNDEGQISYTVDILKRKSSTTGYILDDVMHVTPLNGRIELKHNNLQYIAFKLPVTEGTIWDALTIIRSNPDIAGQYPEFSSDLWKYQYTNVGDVYKNEFFHFNNTVTLNQIDDKVGDPFSDTTAPAHRFYGKEIYAHGVGMVFKEYVTWTFEPMPPFGVGSGKMNGAGVVMKAVEYN